MRSSAHLDAVAWPAERLGEALQALGRAAEFELGPTEALAGAQPGPDGAATGAWIQAAAASMRLEAEPVEVPYREVERLIARAAPAILTLASDREPRFLALLRGGARRVVTLGPDGRLHRLPAATIRDDLCRSIDVRIGPEVDRLLIEAAVPARRRPRARAAILTERLSQVRIGGCWLLAPSDRTSLRRDAGRAGLLRYLVGLIASHAAQHVLLILSWWMLGRGMLLGHIDRGWLLAWALVLLTVAPFRALEIWCSGVLTTRAGVLFKRRMMIGLSRLEPEEIRHQGAGQLLGRVLNAEALEQLALHGGHVGVITLVEFLIAIPILVLGAGGRLHAVLLVGWIALAAVLGWRYFRQREGWTAARLTMTHDLVEQMVGHRTRLAQQRPDRWHEREDGDLERYIGLSAGMDGRAALLRVLVPRGWLLVSLLAITPAWVSGSASPASLAVALGGTLFSFKSFWKFVRGLADMAEAAVAWNQVAPIFSAAGRTEPLARPDFTLAGAGDAVAAPVLIEGHELVFHYGERTAPAIAGCNLTIHAGERLLLEGPSGGGKSTLASLLIGLRVPRSGLLLLEGLDRHSLGAEGWRRRVVSAPQFQENHVLTDTFAFNLLMGREWPPQPADLEEAAEVCRELGLGELLARMPAGLQQMVGESGWQLSHGERSRLYIARALLQRAEFVVLDESFAALDPESLRQALTCVLARARTLLVIAHP